MRFPDSILDPDSILERVRQFTDQLRSDRGFFAEDRDDLSQDLLLRLHRRETFVGVALPDSAVRRILRQGLANHCRFLARKKRKPLGSITCLSSLDTLSGWQPIDPSANGVATSDFELDWVVILATFDRREVRLLERWRSNDWRKPGKLSKRQRKRFNLLRAKLAKRLIELNYLPGGDFNE